MTDPELSRGQTLRGGAGKRIGTVDAVFADYLLVRTGGVLPVDLYVPRPAITFTGDELTVEVSPEEAYERWHRPLRSAPHD